MPKEKTVYYLCYNKAGKPVREPYTDYMDCEKEARRLSNSGGTVHIEQMVRYVHARFQKGQQTLTRSYAMIGNCTEYM